MTLENKLLTHKSISTRQQLASTATDTVVQLCAHASQRKEILNNCCSTYSM